MDGAKRTENTFFPIPTLHYCAAVRYVNVSGFAIEGGGERFIPLDTPFAQIPDSPHPPIFAAIFRRTTGVKVGCSSFCCCCVSIRKKYLWREHAKKKERACILGVGMSRLHLHK
jgi:hypothetical protein